MTNRRFHAFVAILAIAILAVVGLLLLMRALSASEAVTTTPSAATENLADPSAEPNDEIVATVNGQTISQQAWQQATRLDAVMSQLARQPIPTAEETLDRLINEIIVLDAIRAPPFQSKEERPDTALPANEIEARIQALETAWQITDDQVVAALAEAGLERADLTARVSHLVQVEKALNQLAAQEGDLNAWLAAARASAEIGVYRALVAAPLTPATAPEAIFTQPSPQESIPAPEAVKPALSKIEGFAPPSDMPVSPYPQNAAPDFTLVQLTGASLTLSDFRGKPTLINFWATWCPPCRRELPALQAAYTTYRDEIGFIAVNVKEDSSTVSALVETLGLDFPIVLDPDGQVSHISYEVRGIPTTIFVDVYGVVAARHVGPLDEATIGNYLTPLLQEMRSGGAEEQGSESSPPPPSTPAPQLKSAPTFSLTAANGDTISLQDYRDQRHVVLIFYRGYT